MLDKARELFDPSISAFQYSSSTRKTTRVARALSRVSFEKFTSRYRVARDLSHLV